MKNIQTIDDVLHALDAIIVQCHKDRSAIGYFACLYRKMTLAVKKGIDDGIFADATRMTRLDVIFAKRYLKAHELYIQKKQPTRSWKVAFDACQKNEITVIQHLLLGINAHINLDLGIAAAQTSLDKSIDTLEGDFNKINDIISSLVGEVQNELTEIWFPMRFLDKISENWNAAVINFSIGIARQKAWDVATSLAHLPSAQHDVFIEHLDLKIEALALKIRNPSILKRMYLTMLKWTELSDVRQIIDILK